MKLGGGPVLGGFARGGAAVGIGIKAGGPVSFGGPERGGGFGGFAPTKLGFAKIGPMSLPVNESPVPKVTLGVSRVEARFTPHRIFAEPLSVPRTPTIRTRVPDVFQRAFIGKNLDPDARPLGESLKQPGNSVPEAFQRGLANVILDPTKPARQPVPEVKPKTETSPLIKSEVVKEAEAILAVAKQADIKTKVAQTRIVIEAANVAQAPNIAEAALAILPYAVATQLRQQLSETYPQALPKTGVAEAKLASPQIKAASASQLVVVAKPEVEIVQVEEKVKKSIQQEEKSDKDERAFIEDEPVNALRVDDLAEAEQVLEAQVAEGENVDAQQLADIVPDEDESRRSGIVKERGPDGGYKKYKEVLKYAGKFATVKALISYAFEKLKENTAVAFGKGGKKVGDKEVINVLDRGLPEKESVIEVARRLVRLEKPGKVEVSNGVVKVEYETEKTEKVVETKQVSVTVKDTPLEVYQRRLSKLAPRPLIQMPQTAF